MTTTENTKFFDLHATGIGYLGRIREVPVKRGANFLATNISAIHGPADAVQYTQFDCRVSGEEAQRVVKALQHDVAGDRRVLVGFRIGDLYPDAFTYRSGDRAGTTGVVIKGRLLKILWAKVDGEYVYQAPKEDEESQGAVEAPVPAKTRAEQAPEPQGRVIEGQARHVNATRPNRRAA